MEDQQNRITTENFLPTRKQLEREIAHRFQAFHRQKIGSSPKKVSCTIFDNYLVVTVEEAISPVELALNEGGQTDVANQIRSNLDRILKQEIDKIVRETVGIAVNQCVGELNLQTEAFITLVVLEQSPVLRVKRKSFSTSNKNYRSDTATLAIQE